MKVTVKNLDNKEVGHIELADGVFGVPARVDVMSRVVNWQLAKRRAGTHKTKTRSEVARTHAKAYKQKGTGRARRGAWTTNLIRGGGDVHGPQPRDHGFDLPKKIRRLGLKSALSGKLAEGKLLVIDSLAVKQPKTKDIARRFAALGVASALFIDGADIDAGFRRAVANLHKIDVLPQIGANVYDILRHEMLILTKDAVAALEARLK